MTTLTEFLLANPVDDVTEDVIVSNRIKDAEGNVLKFTVKPMLHEQYLMYQKQCGVVKGKKFEFDSKKFNNLIVIGHTTNPKFTDATLVQQAGCVTPEQLMNKLLLAGEIDVLSQQIRRVSGFQDDLDDLVEEAKN